VPGFTDEHNPRPSWLCVDKVPVGNDLPYKEGGNSQEYQASDEVDKAPQQRAGPFPFETPRISKSDGLRADPSPLTFLHSEILDIRARARQLSKLLNWEEEGAVVDHWIENCSMQKEPSRLALGRYLK
jgi:hypothetical protein